MFDSLSLSLFFCCRTMTVEEIFQDREKFSTEVREVAAKDVKAMGLVFCLSDFFVWSLSLTSLPCTVWIL